MEKYEVRMRWASMMDRCENPTNQRYSDYGGRGISVCSEWEDFREFYRWAIDNGLEKGKFLDRIDNNGPYSPENCRYVSQKENSRNTRRSKMITIFNETKNVTSWADDSRCRTTLSAFRQRLLDGWEPEKALTTGDPHSILGFGEYKRVSEWSKDERCIVPLSTVKDRYYSRGWNIEDAITTPHVDKRNLTRKDNVWFEAFGEKKVLAHWARDSRCEVSHETLRRKTSKGISIEEAMKKKI